MFEPEVDRVGAGFNGRAQLRPVAGGAHDFGLAHAFGVAEGRFGEMCMGVTIEAEPARWIACVPARVYLAFEESDPGNQFAQ
jgi:hypothetical protein